MLSSCRTMLLLATLLLSSFSSFVIASPVYGSNSNSTASYSPCLSILPPSPTPSSNKTTTTTFITSPTGISNGTVGSNSTAPTATGRPLLPSTTPASTSAATSLKEFNFGSVGIAAVIAFAVASL